MARSFSVGEVDQPVQPIREPVRQVAWRQTFINLVGGDQSAERLVLGEYMAEFIRKSGRAAINGVRCSFAS